MGFNNGYESGYSDCETENRKRWEREAVEKYKAANPPSGGGGIPSAILDLSKVGLPIYQAVGDGDTPLFSQDKAPLLTKRGGTDWTAAYWAVPLGTSSFFLVAYQNAFDENNSLNLDDGGAYATSGPGIYMVTLTYAALLITPSFDALVL